MKTTTYNIINIAIQSDETIHDDQRQTILNFCKTPTASVSCAKPSSPSYLSAKDMAERWSVSVRTAWRLVQRYQLSPVRIGASTRFAAAQVEKIEKAWQDGDVDSTELHHCLTDIPFRRN